LVPLLHGTLPYTEDEAEEDRDQLAASRGIVIWTLLAVFAWAMVLATVVVW
jgi:hypothetical protein